MEENQMLEKDFKEVFKDIKNEILNAQYDIYKSANIRTLALYSYLGKIIDENAKYGNICYDKPSSGSAHPAAPELRRQTDSDMRTARPPVFWVLLVPGADTHFFYPFTFWFSGPYRAANPKGIHKKAYNYKTAGFLCSAIVWLPQKNYNKSSSP